MWGEMGLGWDIIDKQSEHVASPVIFPCNTSRETITRCYVTGIIQKEFPRERALKEEIARVGTAQYICGENIQQKSFFEK